PRPNDSARFRAGNATAACSAILLVMQKIINRPIQRNAPMNQTFTILAVLCIASLGIDDSAQPEAKQKDTAMVKESAWTWGYFLADKDSARIKALLGERKHAVNVYRVDKVVAVQGKPGVNLDPGSTLIRVESAAKLSVPGEAGPKLLLHGVPQH